MTAETHHTGRSRQWPGERDPTQWDVDQANTVLTSARLDRFKAALLHTEDDYEEDEASSEVEVCLRRALESQSSQSYTYPMALLSEVPSLPPEAEVDRLQNSFQLVFNQHVLLKGLEIGNVPTRSPPPYLQLALACIGSVFDSSSLTTDEPRDVSTDLFIAGVDVWTVMLEVQNTEARILDAVYAAILLATFGTLATGAITWRKTSGILCQVITMSRRLHLTDGHFALQIAVDATEKDASKRSSLFTYMLLVDILHSLHYNTPPNYAVGEIFVKMPSSDQAFRTVYNSLIHGYPLSEPMVNEDALLLIAALLNDIVSNYYRHSQTAEALGFQPAAPLSARSECLRTIRVLKAALHRWERACAVTSVTPDILALQRFAHILILNSQVLKLSGRAGYNSNTATHGQDCVKINLETTELAWRILEDVETSLQLSLHRTSIWLPIVAFISGLVVWRHNSQQGGDLRYGGLRSLVMYENVIKQLPWNCCQEMASTLRRLRKS